MNVYHFLIIFVAVTLVNSETSIKENTSSSCTDETSLSESNTIPVDPHLNIYKIFQYQNKVFELRFYVDKRLSENFLVLKVNEENSKTVSYSFEGTYNQIISYYPEWKVFKSVEQIFLKIVKNDVASDKYSLSIEKNEMTFEFSIVIVDEITPLRIKLTRDVLTQSNTSLDSNSLIDRINDLEAKINKLIRRKEEQELYSYIYNPSNINSTQIIPNGKVAEFKLGMLSTELIEISVELDCSSIDDNTKYDEINYPNGKLPKGKVNYIGTLELTSITGQKLNFDLFNKNVFYKLQCPFQIELIKDQRGWDNTTMKYYSCNSYSVDLSFNHSKSLYLFKGNYNAILNINTNSSVKCDNLTVKKIIK